MQQWSAESWLPYLSLRTDPEYTSAVFTGTRGGGTYYRDLAVFSDINNLRVISEVVTNKATGEVVGSYTRNEDDDYSYDPSLLDVGWGTGQTFSSDGNDYSSNQYQSTESGDGVISAKSVKTFTWDFTLDEQFSKGARVTAIINSEHYENGDNLMPFDD